MAQNLTSSEHSFSLHKAAFSGSLEELQALLRTKEMKIEVYDAAHDTPLHVAAGKGHVKITQWILRKRPIEEIDAYTKNSRGETCLHVAAACGHQQTLEAIADIVELQEDDESLDHTIAFQQDKWGNTILHKAVLRHHLDVVHWIIKRYTKDQGKMLWMKNEDGATALHLAAGIGALDCVQLLTETCNELTAAIDLTGATSLFYAACYGKLDCLKHLDEHGLAQVTSTNCKGENALHMASQCGYMDMVIYLETRMGDKCWQHRSQQGATPVHFAAARNQHKVIQHFLKHKNAAKCINKTDNRKNTPAHIAATMDYVDSFKLLIRGGADLYKANKDGLAPWEIGLKKPRIRPFLFKLTKEKRKTGEQDLKTNRFSCRNFGSSVRRFTGALQRNNTYSK